MPLAHRYFAHPARQALLAAVLACSALPAFAAPANEPAARSPRGAPAHRVQDVEAQNQAIVLRFYEQFFNQKDFQAALDVIVPGYIQHNPSLATGRDAFIALFRGAFERAPNFRTQVIRSIAEGDLVWVHTHQRNNPSDLGRAIIDIYRLEGGKIVEHWDALTPVSASPANANTQF